MIGPGGPRNGWPSMFAIGSAPPPVEYLKARFPDAIAWQVSAQGKRDFQSAEGIRVAPAARLLRELV